MKTVKCIVSSETGFSTPVAPISHKDAVLEALANERSQAGIHSVRAVQALENWLEAECVKDFWDTYRTTP